MSPEQIDRFLTVLERFATVAERWAESEYPKLDESQKAEIYQVGEPKPEPQTKAEYDSFDGPGRFEQRWQADAGKAKS